MKPVNYNTLTSGQRKEIRNRYVEEQGGKCYHCGESLKGKPAKCVRDKYVLKRLFPKGFFNWPIHLHHDHDTSMTVGAVHARCNAVLWQYHGE